jgi:hypothetical protein
MVARYSGSSKISQQRYENRNGSMQDLIFLMRPDLGLNFGTDPLYRQSLLVNKDLFNKDAFEAN